MARALGSRGGKARARTLTADERRHIAALAAPRAAARWNWPSVTRTTSYTPPSCLELQPPPRVERMRTFDGPLPGLYPDKSGS